jgi:hypothetical protein
VIRATVTDGKSTATFAHDGKALSIQGPRAFVNLLLRDWLTPGAHFTISPTKGPYQGFDPNDKVELYDGLQLMRRRAQSLTVDILEASDFPEPWTPYGMDHDELSEDERARVALERDYWEIDEDSDAVP